MKKIDRGLLLIGLIIAILAISIVFALFSQNLKINGGAFIDPIKFSIIFSSLSEETLTGSVELGTPKPEIDADKTTIGNYSVIFRQTGSSLSYIIDITNDGDLTGKISEITVGSDNTNTIVGTAGITVVGTGATSSNDETIVKSGLTYTLKYLDGGDVKVGDVFEVGDTKKAELKLSFDGDTLPENVVTITNLGITLKFEETDETIYILTFNTNEGIFNTDEGTLNQTSIDKKRNEDIKLPTPTRKYTVSYNTNGGTSVDPTEVDYVFNGWYTEKTGGIKKEYTEMPAYNETLYAQWTSTSITLPTVEKLGYTFEGWYTDSALTNKINGKTYIPTENITLYAKWTINQYTVTCIDKVNSTTGTTLGSTTWQADYNSTAYGSTAGSKNTFDEYYLGYVYSSCTNATVTASGCTVYRIFKPVYTITLTKGTGINTVSGPIKVIAGNSTTITATLKTGYYFLNWNITSGTGTISNNIMASTTVTPTSNMTIHAIGSNANILKYGNGARVTFTSHSPYSVPLASLISINGGYTGSGTPSGNSTSGFWNPNGSWDAQGCVDNDNSTTSINYRYNGIAKSSSSSTTMWVPNDTKCAIIINPVAYQGGTKSFTMRSCYLASAASDGDVGDYTIYVSNSTSESVATNPNHYSWTQIASGTLTTDGVLTRVYTGNTTFRFIKIECYKKGRGTSNQKGYLELAAIKAFP